jgi:tetratricopeptide (TPR) repeat protein
VAKGDVVELRQLAHDPDVARQPAPTLDHLGMALILASEFDEAVALLRQAQRLHPHNFWINYDLAFAFASSKPAQYDEAIRYYTAAVALRRVSPGAISNLGNALSNKGRIDEAFICYDEAIRLDPKDALAFNSRGYAWADKQEYAKATADYDEAIGLDPKLALAYNGRAWLWATCPDEKYRDGRPSSRPPAPAN